MMLAPNMVRRSYDKGPSFRAN